MLKITGQRDTTQQGVSLVIEGRLTGPWVEELETYCRIVAENQQRCTKIDLTGVTFIDADGKALLARLWQDGVELRASGCLTRCIVEQIMVVGRPTPSCRSRDGIGSTDMPNDT